MSLVSRRNTSFVAWSIAVLACLVGLTNLLAMEPPAQPSKSEHPTATLLDVTELPAHPDVTPAAVPQEPSRERRLLIPFDADEWPSPREAIPAEHPRSTEVPAVKAPAKVPQQWKPKTTSNAVETLPIIPLPQQAAPATNGPAVRYWIVSSRCCPQKSHRCGVGCRFICYAVLDNNQCLPVSFEQFLAGQIPHAPTCIMIHGSFTRIQDVWEDSDCTDCWLRAACPQSPLNHIYYTWPSEGPFALQPHNPFSTLVPCLDFAVLGHRAEYNGFYVADLIGSLPPTTTVSLIGHSLGTRTIASALHLMAGGTVHGQRRWNPVDAGQRIRVVLAAAAIEHDWLNPNDRYGCALHRAECLINLRNEKDAALALFPLRRPFSSRALARSGFTSKDQRKLGEHSTQVAELDVTQVVGRSHGWPNYCKHFCISRAIAPYLFFEAASPLMPVEAARVAR